MAILFILCLFGRSMAVEVGGVSVETHLDKLKTSANIAVSFEASGVADEVIVSMDAGGALTEKKVNAEGQVRCYLKIAAPLIWSAEKPRLYDFKITGSSGEELVAAKIGIRETDFSSGVLRVNSVDAHLKMPTEAIDKVFPYGKNTAKMLKGCNANAVIVDYGEGSGALLDTCDELGIYVLLRCEEASFAEVLVAERNHCSIIGWIVPVPASAEAAFRSKMKRLDNSRPLFTIDLPQAASADFKLYDKFLYETYAVKGFAPMAEVGYEAKKKFEPLNFTISGNDAKETLINISNNTSCTDLSEMKIIWRLLKNGLAVQGAILQAQAAPGESARVAVPVGSALPADAEYVLEIVAIAPSGSYELAFEQFMLRPASLSGIPQGKGELVCSALDKDVTISGEWFEVRFDISEGCMTDLIYAGTDLLQRSPECDFSRAPSPFTKSISLPWDLLLGLERTVLDVNYIRGKDKAIVRVKTIYAKDLSKPEAPGFNIEEVYSIFPGGVITVDVDIEPFGEMPAELGRIGMQMILPRGFEQVSYYGKGPAQSYPDCLRGARLGLFSFAADDMFTAREGCAEFGNRSGVRSFSVFNASGAGLTISGTDLNISASHYPAEHLAGAMDGLNPVKVDSLLLNVDHAVSPLVHAVAGTKATLPAKFSFTISPYNAAQ
ncbi:MAG: beta-galactosidase domain 4-containing protein [Phycisphaerae bacterium]|jgi:hypothetical protein